MKENTHFCNYEAVTTRKKKRRDITAAQKVQVKLQFDNVLGLD